MRAILLLLACIPLSGCGLFARYAGDVEIPVDETEQIVDLAATLPRFDLNEDGVIDATELDAFLTWFGSELVRRFVPAPQAPPEVSET